MNRGRSGRLHVIGDDEPPAPQAMQRAGGGGDEPAAAIEMQATGAGAGPVEIRPLTLDLVEGLRRVNNEGFGSKYCCLCCPVADTDGSIAQFYAQHPERLPLCGLAVDGAGAPLGFVQLAIHPLHDKDGLHSTKPGETYIEQVGVAAVARGQGIGRRLLQWAEAQARARDCTTLTLAVLNGNPARRLYERIGFRAKPTDECGQCIGAGCVFCLVGRPYGACAPGWGATDMVKVL